ncbi:MAG: hypothetical protein SPD80_01750 [Atopobium sp.]|uniref:hypothetical protein n=1 Tax=Atopobium sp. TaxID=1872650 RepID=UPI002A815B81|nr:hypothetical protein [Atopobium sp.]MDY4522302.1 hypothetical protein [Atopobium sp.]
MWFFIGAIVFHLVALGMFIATIYLVVVFTKAVRRHQHIPAWMYKIGHVLKGRGADSLENLTDVAALKETYVFLCGFVVLNGAWYLWMLGKGLTVHQALFSCLKHEVFICLSLMALHNLIRIIITSIHEHIDKTYRSHNYASTSAVVGMLFMSCFIQMFALMFTGVPARPYTISIAQNRVVIGTTHASELLQQGFTFEDRRPEDMIVNQRNNHAIYGQSFELTRNGISYGTILVTPEWTTTARLQDCVITSFSISNTDGGFNEIYLEGKQLTQLTRQYLHGKKLVDVLGLTPADYRETQGKTGVSLQLQTHPYTLWKRYLLEEGYNSAGEPQYFAIRAHHIVWE